MCATPALGDLQCKEFFLRTSAGSAALRRVCCSPRPPRLRVVVVGLSSPRKLSGRARRHTQRYRERRELRRESAGNAEVAHRQRGGAVALCATPALGDLQCKESFLRTSAGSAALRRVCCSPRPPRLRVVVVGLSSPRKLSGRARRHTQRYRERRELRRESAVNAEVAHRQRGGAVALCATPALCDLQL